MVAHWTVVDGAGVWTGLLTADHVIAFSVHFSAAPRPTTLQNAGVIQTSFVPEWELARLPHRGKVAVSELAETLPMGVGVATGPLLDDFGLVGKQNCAGASCREDR